MSVIIVFVSSLCVWATELQGVDETVNMFKNSLKNKDTHLITNFLDDIVELTYKETHSTYTKSQTLVILEDFYAKSRPTNFVVNFKGVSPNSDAQYVICTVSSKTEHFRIYLYLKNKQGKYLIQEIKISKQ